MAAIDKAKQPLKSATTLPTLPCIFKLLQAWTSLKAATWPPDSHDSHERYHMQRVSRDMKHWTWYHYSYASHQNIANVDMLDTVDVKTLGIVACHIIETAGWTYKVVVCPLQGYHGIIWLLLLKVLGHLILSWVWIGTCEWNLQHRGELMYISGTSC